MAPDDRMSGLRELVATEDVLSRKEQRDAPLYAGRIKVHPKSVSGPVRRIKWAVLITLLGLYYLAPWLRWDRGPGVPDQAFLVDIVGRRVYFLFIEIWPQELYYMAGLLMIAAFGLFLATSIGGRVWCGFTCPQTVWTDLFMWIERHIEGDRNARIRLDKQPMSAAKLGKRVLKHTTWLVISLLTGGAWIMYFNDAPTVVREFFTGQSGVGVYFFTGLFSATTYLLGGLAREQVCTYMCPWPRFQAALLDEDSLVVTYQKWRGEPRGKHKKGQSWDNRGDCIDCKQCVAVCPTGIDIRDGIQLECIGCGLCIDACNDVMAKVDRPRNLISFDTERRQIALNAGQPAGPPRVVRARLFIYLALILGIGAAVLAGLATRSTLDITVLHDRNPLFVTLSDGSIRNGYTIKILNKSSEPRSFALTLDLPQGASLSAIGPDQSATGGPVVFTIPPDSVASRQVFVQLPRDRLDSDVMDIAFVLSDTDGDESVRYVSSFRGPR